MPSAWLGVTDIAASQGHWAFVARFLEFGMRNAVARHAKGIEAPNLDNPDLITLGHKHSPPRGSIQRSPIRSRCAPIHAPYRAPSRDSSLALVSAPFSKTRRPLRFHLTLKGDPARHTGIFEPVLDDPEQLALLPRPHRDRQIRRRGQHMHGDRVDGMPGAP
jgi:hypothetical protein